MDNIIQKSKIKDLLKKDGNIFHLISKNEQSEMKRLLFSNKPNWEKIFDLPEFVYHAFDMRMRRNSFVTEKRMSSPPLTGPHVLFEGDPDRPTITIDTDNSDKGIVHYRRCLSVVAYYVALRGGMMNVVTDDHAIHISEEDWIIISIAARYCLMPPKFIQKVFVLTQFYLEDESNENLSKKPFLHSFVDHLVFQTDVPKWVVLTRLHEHSFASDEFADIIGSRTIDAMIEEYRKNEFYTAPAV